MEKVKKIAKYVVNVLAIINALLVGIGPVWGLDVTQITETISVVMAVTSTYLLGQKAVNSLNEPPPDDEEKGCGDNIELTNSTTS